MKKQDSIQHKKFLDAVTAEKLIRAWIEIELKNYQEPVRKGIAKGDPIGFPLSKQKAVRWMLFYPYFKLHFIAKGAGVSPGVLRVWKTEEGFQREIKATAKRLVNAITNMNEFEITKRYRPETQEPTEGRGFKIKQGSKELDGMEMVRMISDAIFFLNFDLVHLPILKWIQKKIKSSPMPEREIYVYLLGRMISNIHIKDEESFRKYIRTPEMVNINKFMIERDIDCFVSPEAFKNESPERIREKLKKLILQVLDEYIF